MKQTTERVVSSRKRTKMCSVPMLCREPGLERVHGRRRSARAAPRAAAARSSPARSSSTSFSSRSERTSRTWSTGSLQPARQLLAAARRWPEERPVRARARRARSRPARSGRGSRAARARGRRAAARSTRRGRRSPVRDISFASAQPWAGASASSASTDHSPGRQLASRSRCKASRRGGRRDLTK